MVSMYAGIPPHQFMGSIFLPGILPPLSGVAFVSTGILRNPICKWQRRERTPAIRFGIERAIPSFVDPPYPVTVSVLVRISGSTGFGIPIVSRLLRGVHFRYAFRLGLLQCLLHALSLELSA